LFVRLFPFRWHCLSTGKWRYFAVSFEFEILFLKFAGFQFPAFFFFRLIELHEATKRQRKMAEEEKKAANVANMVFSNMTTIKAYTLQNHFHTIFHNALKPLRR
jgi:hypothetical protein